MGECNDIGIIHHPKQLRTCRADEALADFGFVLALGFAEEEDGFHRSSPVLSDGSGAFSIQYTYLRCILAHLISRLVLKPT